MAFRIRNGERAAARPRGSRGFSLPIVMIMTAVASYSASRLEVSAQYRGHRDREEELLFRGAAYVRAIKSFYTSETAPGKKRLPGSLDELVKDPRAQNRRHLRALYPDPMTGREFKVQKRPEGIVAVASSSEAAPLQQVDFAEDLGLTEGARHYNEWIFEAKLGTPSKQGGLTPPVVPPAPKK